MDNTMRPMHNEFKPSSPLITPKSATLTCKTWESEAALRMLHNNLNEDVAVEWESLIVYGGSGRAARNWQTFNYIVKSLKDLEADETLLVQSGKAVGILKTFTHAPRVLLANSNLVPAWSNFDYFDSLDRKGLMMYGQMTAGSWIYIGTQGIIQGTFETFAELANQHFNGSLEGTITLTAGLGGMSGAQPHAITMNGGVAIIVECRKERIERKLKEKYLDAMALTLEEAKKMAITAKNEKRSLSIGLLGNAAEIFDQIANSDFLPDIVTDQTSAHSLLDYVPEGEINSILKLHDKDPESYKNLSLKSIVKHCAAIIKLQERGCIAFDYGNNLRAFAEKGGVKVRDENGNLIYPGFIPAYIRPLFCKGEGPFRWAALSGDISDIEKIDNKMLELFPDNKKLHRWIKLAKQKIPQLGLPARICWLGYGDRAKAGVAINEMVRNKELKAPIVIGRDHLDCGSVASPFRETEAMLDGSDAVADWPLLNAMSNISCGADWVSLHNGGGVGIGYSTHAGMVVVATGTQEKEERLKRVLTSDPALGIMRHADAGYPDAINNAKKFGVRIPHLG
jgi:urocanate hydratase